MTLMPSGRFCFLLTTGSIIGSYAEVKRPNPELLPYYLVTG